MKSPRPVHGYVAAVIAASAICLVPSRASASSCTTDADCGKGLSCQVVGMSACANITCPAGETCPPQPPCTPTEIKECVLAPCNTDSDCGDGMVCYTNTQTSCEATPPPAAPCAPNTQCDPLPPPPPPSCTTTTEKLCVPRYLLPCTTAADCGAGFSCVPDQSCSTSGSAGVGFADAGIAVPVPAPAPAPSGSGGAPAPAPDPAPSGSSAPPSGDTCTTLPTNHCEAQIIDCSTDANCPAGWTCTETPSVGTGCAVAVYPDGGTSMPSCPPTPMPAPTKECAPPYSDVIGGAADHGGIVNVPQAGSFTGSAGSSGTGGSSATGAPGAPPNSDSMASGVASSQDSGGCQVGRGTSGASASLLALAGLIGLARRRRARAT